jgi:hypothetical protein
VSGAPGRIAGIDTRVIVVLLVVAGVAVGAVAALTVGGGGSPGPTLPPPTSASTDAPTAVATAAPVSPAPSGPRAVIDHGLLSLLPPAVGGFVVRPFPEAETQAVTDPDLGRNVSRFATAFVGDANGANWAYTAIVDVRPEARSDAFYRDWQESFDASACQPAGGVGGHTQVVIAGHDVERTACGGGVRTYHVRLAGGVLLSISDLGDARLGEQEIAALPR